jgi:predicted RNA-binding protein YlxR (DUF448 family)
VACRTERQKRDLVRIVRTPAGQVVLDPTGRQSGRGAYLCADRACWQTALKRHSIERALEAALPAELRERLAAADTGAIDPTPNTDQTINQGGIRGT